MQTIGNSFGLPRLQIKETDLSKLPWEVPSICGLVSLELASLDPLTKLLLHEGLPSPITGVGGHLRWSPALWTSFCERQGGPLIECFGSLSASGVLEFPCADIIPEKVQVTSELPKVPSISVQKIELLGSDSGVISNQVSSFSTQTSAHSAGSVQLEVTETCGNLAASSGRCRSYPSVTAGPVKDRRRTSSGGCKHPLGATSQRGPVVLRADLPSCFTVAAFNGLGIESQVRSYRGWSGSVIPTLLNARKSTSRKMYHHTWKAYISWC